MYFLSDRPKLNIKTGELRVMWSGFSANVEMLHLTRNALKSILAWTEATHPVVGSAFISMFLTPFLENMHERRWIICTQHHDDDYPFWPSSYGFS